jgi:hypothetical protein
MKMTIIERSQQVKPESIKSVSKVLLIDLENCPCQIHQLMHNLEQYSQVVVCYAESGAKVPLDWILPLTATVRDNRLKIVKMPNGGKNAADFGITFWSGVLMAELPEYAHFDIVSNDIDLDYAVSLLVSKGRSAERIGVDQKNQSKPSNTPSLRDKEYYLQEFCLHLVKYQNNRPTKKEALLNSIENKFKVDMFSPDNLFEMLIKQDVISVIDNKITYNQQKITKFAGL